MILIKKYKLFFIIIFLLLLIVTGLRSFGAANDYYNYWEMVTSKNVALFQHKEVFFKALIHINDYLFNSNFTVFLFIFAFLGLSIKLNAFLKLSPLPFLSLIFYLLSYYWVHEYIQIRAGVATGIFLFALNDLSNNRYKGYFIKSLLAIMFHWSSLVLIPLFFVLKYLNLRAISLLPTFGILLYLSDLNLFSIIEILLSFLNVDIAVYNTYGGYQDEINVLNLMSLSYLFIQVGFTALIYSSKFRFEKFELILYKTFSVGIFIFFATSLLNAPVISFRLLEYFNTTLFLLIPYIIVKFRQRNALKLLFTLYFILYFTFLMTNVIEFSDHIRF